jgi:hypothetical protein
MNFISMLERGLSKIPFTKIPQIADAYGLPASFCSVMVKELYPDQWQVIMAINERLHDAHISGDELERNMDETYMTKLKEFRIE